MQAWVYVAIALGVLALIVAVALSWWLVHAFVPTCPLQVRQSTPSAALIRFHWNAVNPHTLYAYELADTATPPPPEVVWHGSTRGTSVDIARSALVVGRRYRFSVSDPLLGCAAADEFVAGAPQ